MFKTQAGQKNIEVWVQGLFEEKRKGEEDLFMNMKSIS
jgi:hypothetical protein